MQRSLSDVATVLANSHRDADPATKIIKYFPGAAPDRICLVEVSDLSPTTREILPFPFPADPGNGVDFESVVILLSPEEWSEVKGGQLALPEGWNLEAAVSL